MNPETAKGKLETIHWVFNVALLTTSRYRSILLDSSCFDCVFPGTVFENPTITHAIDGTVVLKTSKDELLREPNHDLFKAYQVFSGIIAMASIIEAYLALVVERTAGSSFDGRALIPRFERLTGIDLDEVEGWDDVRYFVQVRHISAHNQATIDERFVERGGRGGAVGESYVFYPIDLTRFLEGGTRFIDALESRLAGLARETREPG